MKTEMLEGTLVKTKDQENIDVDRKVDIDIERLEFVYAVVEERIKKIEVSNFHIYCGKQGERKASERGERK